ncbi:MAG: hypothetical protein ABIG37_00800 [Nanoarchaeota archaeon]
MKIGNPQKSKIFGNFNSYEIEVFQLLNSIHTKSKIFEHTNTSLRGVTRKCLM